MRTALLAVFFGVLCSATLPIPIPDRHSAIAAQDARDADREAVGKSIERFAKLPPQQAPVKDILSAAEKSPAQVIGCSIDDSQTVYATYAVCLSVMSIVSNPALKRGIGLTLLQGCAAMPSTRCYAMIDELQDLIDNAGSKSKTSLIEGCADHAEKAFPGNARTQYVQACQNLADYLK